MLIAHFLQSDFSLRSKNLTLLYPKEACIGVTKLILKTDIVLSMSRFLVLSPQENHGLTRQKRFSRQNWKPRYRKKLNWKIMKIWNRRFPTLL